MNLPEPLNCLSSDELSILSSHIQHCVFPKGTCIFQEGGTGDCCYIIDNGLVRIELERTELDSESVLTYLEKGAILGELSLLDNLPRSASAYAQTEVEARFITSASIAALTKTHPALVVSLLTALGRGAAKKLRETTGRLATLIFTDNFSDVDHLVEQADSAHQEFISWPEDKVDSLLTALAGVVYDHAVELASETVRTTEIGNVEDKTLKNRAISHGICQYLQGKTGFGPITQDKQRGITELASPVGVVFGLIPVTNPVATAIFKALICLKGRNALIMSFNRLTQDLGPKLIEMLQEVIQQHGAPRHLVQCIENRNSRRKTEMFMRHRKITFILATGGTGMVKAAYSSGKPAIGVGPSNTPTVVCPDADLKHAAYCVVLSKSFDNGLICGSEHNLVVHKEIHDVFIGYLEEMGAAVLNSDEAERFNNIAVSKTRFRPEIMGICAAELAEQASIEREQPIKVIIVPTRDVSSKNPWAHEKMAPVSSLFTVANEEESFNLSRKLLDIEGKGHTAIIHTKNKETARQFGIHMQASRILVNSPGSQGVIGITTELTPSLTLGCGTFGGNSTTDNVNYHHLLNIKRLAEFRAPENETLSKIFCNENVAAEKS